MRDYREIYRAAQMPVFQNRMFNSVVAARDCQKGDVVLVQDPTTALIFNQAFRPELMQYDVDYQNEQGFSTAFQRHLHNVSQVVVRHFSGQKLIEVGCGKGQFLEQLLGLGFDITGLDPTYEGDSERVIKNNFTRSIGLQADGIVLRHVLEHVPDPVTFLHEIREANGGRGKIYIEVPCLQWIADHHAWFDIFYEHVNYFRLEDFSRMFGVVHEASHTFNGQYIYVVAELASLRIPQAAPTDRFELPPTFLSTLERSVDRARVMGNSVSNSVAVWGGASKGVIFALFMERAGVKVDVVVDINPAKQGRYLAATGLRVHSPEEAMQLLKPGADLFVMNKNYLNEIQDLTNRNFNYIPVEHENV